mgnify:CR=1 FL=1
MKIIWPNAGAVAAELKVINMNVEGETTVRLYVIPSGKWLLHLGDTVRMINETNNDPSGIGSLPGYKRRFNPSPLARDLIAQAKASRP